MEMYNVNILLLHNAHFITMEAYIIYKKHNHNSLQHGHHNFLVILCSLMEKFGQKYNYKIKFIELLY
jgi:hypothetical protein